MARMGSWGGVEQYHCMSSLDSGGKPVDGIARAVFWKDRGRFNISYKLIRINAHKIVRATFWQRQWRCKSLVWAGGREHRIRRYYCMGLLDLRRQRVDGVARATFRQGRGHVNDCMGSLESAPMEL